MPPWINDRGCQIFFERLASIDEHGAETGYVSYSWWCTCNRSQDDYERLPDCVESARAHIEE